MVKVYFAKPAAKDLKRLPRFVQESLRNERIPALAKNPHAGKLLHGPLRGYFSYDFHVGSVSYRVAYKIISNDVVIIMINTRENFYKKFSRRI